MKFRSVLQFYAAELRVLYSVEYQLVQALPTMAETASVAALQNIFWGHLRQTKNQVDRLETIFERLGQNPNGKVCNAMKELLAEREDFEDDATDPECRDARMISLARRVEHYEVARYATVLMLARRLCEADDLRLLEESFGEELQADGKLARLADTLIDCHNVTLSSPVFAPTSAPAALPQAHAPALNSRSIRSSLLARG